MAWTLRPHDSRAAAETALADRVAAVLRAGLAERERALLVAPGGSTPAGFLRRLADADLPWERVTVIPSDERWVPAEDPRANARLLRETLLTGPAARAALVPLVADGASPALDAEAAEARVRAARDAAGGAVDACVLGMGGDLHTASLFPGADGLASALDPATPSLVRAIRPADGGLARVTLTLPVLAGARGLVGLIFGADKRARLAEAADLPAAEAPIAAVAAAAERPGAMYWAP
jgi:6-phosphogluconolactonase